MPTRCSPGVFGTWAKYIAPNLPAPTRPTRSGLPSASRSRSLAYRFIALSSGCDRRPERCLRRAIFPGQRNVVVLQQAIIGQALDRREVAMRDVLGPLEPPYVIGNRAQAQVDVDPVPGRKIAVRRMHQAGMEQD